MSHLIAGYYSAASVTYYIISIVNSPFEWAQIQDDEFECESSVPYGGTRESRQGERKTNYIECMQNRCKWTDATVTLLFRPSQSLEKRGPRSDWFQIMCAWILSSFGQVRGNRYDNFAFVTRGRETFSAETDLILMTMAPLRNSVKLSIQVRGAWRSIVSNDDNRLWKYGWIRNHFNWSVEAKSNDLSIVFIAQTQRQRNSWNAFCARNWIEMLRRAGNAN